MKIKLTAIAAMCLAGMAFAETITTDGDGNITINVPNGETATYSGALPASKVTVTKTGGGTIKLSTAATTFTGTLAVNEGYVDVTVIDAGGRGVIEVADGAAAIFSYVNGGDASGQSRTTVQAEVKIAGMGPDNQGALRYTATGGGSKSYGDVMFKLLTLTADAGFKADRVGAVTLDMQGHTLTWLGRNWMFFNCTWKNFGKIIHNGTGDICFQAGTFDSTCTADKEIVINNNSGYISYWNCGTAVPFKLVVSANTQIIGNSGFGASRNVWEGPIEIMADKTLKLNAGSGKSLHVKGKISGAGAVLAVGDGPVYLDNDANDWTGGLTVSGFNLFALAPGSLPGLTEGKVRLTGNGDTMYFIRVAPTDPIPGMAVQHVWTPEEIDVLERNVVRTSSQHAGIGFDVPSGKSFTYANDVYRNYGHNSTGTVTFTGNFVKTDTTNVSINVTAPGRVVLDHADAAKQNMRTFNINSDGVLHVKNGNYELDKGMIRVGNGSRGAVWQEEGTTVNQISTDTPYIAENVSCYGMWYMDGGYFKITNTITCAKGLNSFGGLFMKGGTFKQTAGNIYVGYNGNSIMYISGGATNDTKKSSAGGMYFVMGQRADNKVNGGENVVTVTGTNSFLRTEGIIIGQADYPCTNVINLCDGGEFEVTRFYKNSYAVRVDSISPMPAGCWSDGSKSTNGTYTLYMPYTNGCFSVVNVNGGVMYPSYAWGWNHVGESCPPRDPDKIVLYENGLVVDTSRCMDAARTYYAGHTFPFHLNAATGRGFDAIYLPTNNAAFMAQKYIGPARVIISDAKGWAATAIADFDKETGKLTEVIVTSRGCDYSANPTVRVESADRTQTFACTYELSQNVCGGLTKRGAQNMEIASSNDYSGITCVESGQLTIKNDYSVPKTSHCLVKDGATVHFHKAMTLKSVGGAGRITGQGFTATDGVVADPDALNANKGLTVSGAVTFGENAKVGVSDRSAIAGGRSKWPLLTSSSAITGNPVIDRESLPPPYDIMFSPDRKTLYLTCPRGTTLIIR